MYEQITQPPVDFLQTTFILMRKNVREIKELNLKQKRGKSPLPNLS